MPLVNLIHFEVVNGYAKLSNCAPINPKISTMEITINVSHHTMEEHTIAFALALQRIHPFRRII